VNPPESNRLTIRLEISAPIGASVAVDEPKAAGLAPPAGGRHGPLWIGAGNPGLTTTYTQAGPNTIPVRPQPGSNLGTICLALQYVSPYPTKVMALVYPIALWHQEADPTLTPALAGRPNGTGAIWTWDGNPDGQGRGAALVAADYTPSGPGAANKISVWYWNGSAWVIDKPLPFTGTMGTSGPCGSGGGSGSGSGGSKTVVESITHPHLVVVIADGPHAGRHVAAARGPRGWALTVGGEAYELDTTADGATFVLRCRSSVVVSRSVAFDPFSATFPGEPFGSHRDAVVRT
jgi:hypothetical protein